MLKYSAPVSHRLRKSNKVRLCVEQYTDIQFSRICLSNEPIDGSKVTTVTIQLCRLEATIAWFLLRSEKQQAQLNLCSFHAARPPLHFYRPAFNLPSTDMIYHMSSGKQVSPGCPCSSSVAPAVLCAAGECCLALFGSDTGTHIQGLLVSRLIKVILQQYS